MAISLQKGQGVNLRKDTGFDLSRLNIGLGWDVANHQPPYDLDAVAFLLGSNGKVNHLGKLGSNGRPTLEGGEMWCSTIPNATLAVKSGSMATTVQAAAQAMMSKLRWT